MIGGNLYGFSDLLVVKDTYNACLKCSESDHGFSFIVSIFRDLDNAVGQNSALSKGISCNAYIIRVWRAGSNLYKSRKINYPTASGRGIKNPNQSF
jgi:hypothetical protein